MYHALGKGDAHLEVTRRLEAHAFASDVVGGFVLGLSTSDERERYARAVATLNDARRAAQFARDLQALATIPHSEGRIVSGAGSLNRARRVGLLAGSFNPLTRAHVALADAARVTGRLDSILWTLSVITVDKERVERASLIDRLLQMVAFVRDGPDALALINRGLYVDQASVVSRLVPHLEELFVVVGFDKIVQILDPRYYEGRDAVLNRLFTSASLLVAPRLDEDEESLNALLAREENRKYQRRITFCPLKRRFRGDSSSTARAIAGELRGDRRLRMLLPPEGRALVVATGAFSQQSPIPSKGLRQADAYLARQSIILWLAGLDPERVAVPPHLDALIARRLEMPGQATGDE